MINLFKGDIFKSRCQAILNPVNTQGVSGKGLALQFANRYPEMQEEYRRSCESGDLVLGKVLVWPIPGTESPRCVICFPTKVEWKRPSRMKYIRAGLKALSEEVLTRNITSVAFPALGSGLGKLPWSGAKGVRSLLLHWGEEHAEITVEIYEPD